MYVCANTRQPHTIHSSHQEEDTVIDGKEGQSPGDDQRRQKLRLMPRTSRAMNLMTNPQTDDVNIVNGRNPQTEDMSIVNVTDSQTHTMNVDIIKTRKGLKKGSQLFIKYM